MPRAKGFDYDKTEDGRPTPSHIWEEKFFVAGHKGPPPEDDLRGRIAQLVAACEDAKQKGATPMKGWLREIDWRMRQLAIVTRTEATDGDSQHQE